jgi:hypothetical protein
MRSATKLRSQALDVLIARTPDITPEQEDSARRAFAAGRLSLRSDGKTLDEMTTCEREHLLESSPALYLLMSESP